MSKLQELLKNKINIDLEMEKRAKEIYDEVAALLEKELGNFCPKIFCQGSFRLKTVIRPVKGDEYDLDFVCLLNINKDAITQEGLKQLVGNALKKQYAVEAKKRCWRINMKGFHVDVLPAVPETDMVCFEQLENSLFAETPIAIPDKELKMWQCSNPVGYARWFAEQTGKISQKNPNIIVNEKERLPKQNTGCSILQDVIKIMKYHRDIKFKDNLDNKPISIILTTLVAQCYDGEQDLEEALYDVMQRIVLSAPTVFEECLVPNPVLPSENFADKWANHPECRQAFRDWVFSLNDVVSKYYLHRAETGALEALLTNGFGLSNSAATYARNLREGLIAGGLGLGTNGTITSAAKAAGQATKFFGQEV